MDMAVADLLKHKIRLTFRREVTEIYEPESYKRGRYYFSPIIENVESIGVNDPNDLCTTLFKPFFLYAISKVVHEDHDIPIDTVTIKVGINDLQEYEDYGIAFYRFENPQVSPELFFTHAEVNTRPFPNHLLNQPFRVVADVICYFVSDWLRELEFREAFNYENRDEESPDDESTDEEEDPPAPLIETYRRERCVICLESTPNILYLDCMHIAVCDSCDDRSNQCVVCREEISKRIKI